MKKYPWLWVWLCFSVILNLLLASYVLVSDEDKQHELSWTRKAAKEAEDVASVFCSGHGRAFLDGEILSSTTNHLEGVTEGIDNDNNPPLPSCECNSCYYGSDCSQFSADCPANADSGDPLFLEPFWVKHAESSAVMVSGWHRMSYKFGYENGTFISKELERHIQKLHAMVGNANSTGKFMVFGAGSTQLLNAAIYALSPQDPPSPTRIVGSIPFFPVYKSQTEFYNSKNFEWEGDTSMWKKKSFPPSVNFIEFVTSPNNPDGKLKDPVLQGPSVKTINDHAYYWPHYTAIPAPANEDLVIFTLSKLTGHGSSRFGWALIKDQVVYEKFLNYMLLNSMGVSRDTQLRALKLLKVLLRDGKEFFEFGHRTTRTRWESLNKVISASKRFSLQKLIPGYSTYFQNMTAPSPAYAWIKCEKEEDNNCYQALLRDGGIIGRSGSFFSAENRYVRLSLIKSQDDFDWLLKRMNALVSQELVHEQYNVKMA
ncbi:hypothetical protein C5167_044735 [Papaver somniferum]|uniref:tryptophan aminotransferase-related protein 3-like n=1 Tax=Papaver somniferum TaxID=3469 RepID=UPI000E701905|nr:tryptophan aminotransferase-related protein 3-like [Papaver somniferum]RZC90108.1 hypothetical protein C5167_044735 [Papaver somniferum]